MGIMESMALIPVWTGVSTHDDAGGDPLDLARALRLDGALPVDRLPERVHDAADQRVTDRNLDDAAGGLDLIALLERGVVAQDQSTHRLLLEVEGHAHDPVWELQQLRGERSREPIDLGDPVADLDDRPDARDVGPFVEALDFAADDRGDLV
jgi:hypothetical protein